MNKFVIFNNGNYLQQESLTTKPIWREELSTAMRCASCFGAEAISEVTGGRVFWLGYRDKPTHEYIWDAKKGKFQINSLDKS